MADITITGLSTAKGLLHLTDKERPVQGFDKIMQDAIGKLYQIQNDTEKAAQDLATGADMTQAIVAMEKADMSFQLMIEVRNKLLSAYEEVMRMQI